MLGPGKVRNEGCVANRPDDPQYIVRLIAQVITVSLETVRIVKNLPPLQTSSI
jgi:predicted helicase